jgi:hypothetical protein
MKTLLKVLVAIFALGLSASAAYFSVLGLTKMFAGAVIGTAIVCSFIEGSKLVIASVLHQFNKRLGWAIKGMLVIFLLLAMAITSMGVYGYLTNAFQSTANQLEVIEGKTGVLAMKRDRFQESLDSYVVEKKDLTNSITELTKGLSNNVIEYKDKETGEIIRTTSSSTRRVLEKQVEDAKAQRDKVTLKIEALTDSVTRLDIIILELNSNEDIAAEIGPLKFITQLTGLDMNRVVNFLTLIIVLIVDPLAIVLVVVFNKIGKEEKFEVKMSVPEGMEFNKPYPIPDSWKEEPEDEDEDYPEPNEQLTDAAKRYKELMNDDTQKTNSDTTRKTNLSTEPNLPIEKTPHIDGKPISEDEFYGETKRPKRFG